MSDNRLPQIATFDTPPVIGQSVTGSTTFPTLTRTVTWGGTYLGMRPSEHDGEAMHLFKDGFVGDSKQPFHAIPVSSFTGIQ
jgi:hypothetical protein